jgi:hemolysin activation/secretion protein
MVLTVASVSWSQVPSQVKPGAVEQSLEPERFPEPGQIPDLIIRDRQKGEIEAAPGVSFTLKDVRFQGNTVFSSDTLRSLIADRIGQTIRVETLTTLADRITQHYKQNGYILSRAYIPPQTIKDAVVIKVREGRLGDIIVQGNQRYSDRLINRTLQIIHKRGAVNLEDLERGLLLLTDIPGLEVKATLKPGSEPGTTDIVLEAMEDRGYHVGFDYNNYGTDVVSEHRFGVSTSATNLTGLGDLLTVRGVTGEEGFSGLLYARADYSMLLGYEGARWGLYLQHLEYELQEEFEVFDYEGRSFAGGAWVSYPFYRTRQFSWWGEVGVDVLNQEQEIMGEDIGEDRVRPFHVANTFQINDRFGGRNSLRLNAVFNKDSFMGGTDNEDEDFIRQETEFNFFKLELDATRYQKLPAGFGLILSVVGQASGDRLPSSQQLAMGGQGTVRGYEQSEFSADNGGYFNAELRIPILGAETVKWFGTGKTIGETLQLALFLDGGFANINDPLSDSEEEMDDADFGGGGLGLRFTYSPWFNLHADYAHHLFGDDPQDEDVEDNGIFYIRASLLY